MRLVPGPAQAGTALMRRWSGPLAVALATGLSALLVTWQPASGGQARDYLPGSTRAGSGALNQVATADCTQYVAGSTAQQRAVIGELEGYFGHSSRIFRGATMPTSEALDTMRGACAKPQARSIKLYKIYARALVFRNAGRTS